MAREGLPIPDRPEGSGGDGPSARDSTTPPPLLPSQDAAAQSPSPHRSLGIPQTTTGVGRIASGALRSARPPPRSAVEAAIEAHVARCGRWNRPGCPLSRRKQPPQIPRLRSHLVARAAPHAVAPSTASGTTRSRTEFRSRATAAGASMTTRYAGMPASSASERHLRR